MAPPVTPSPHRFITGKHRRIARTDDTRSTESSKERSDVDPDLRPKSAPMKHGPASRFAPANMKPKPVPQDEPPRPSLAQALKVSSRSHDSVEETNDDHDDTPSEEMINAIPTTEHEPTKRPFLTNKRPHESLDFPTPARPVFRHPETPASQTKDPPRFTRPYMPSPAEVDASQRPTFLRPSAAPSAEPMEPLPDAFSPHRRGQKYLSGGMASMLQQWVLETAQEASQTRRAQAYLQGEDDVLRVRICELSGGGPWLANGRTAQDEEKSLLIIRPEGDKAAELKLGCVVGIRVPTWEVGLLGKQWIVAVDWTSKSTW